MRVNVGENNSFSAREISFEFNLKKQFISKEIGQTEHGNLSIGTLRFTERQRLKTKSKLKRNE